MSAVGIVPATVTRGRPAWIVGLAYVAAFLLLDWVSYFRPFEGLNVTPWNPQPALAVALLLRNPRWLWLVWLSLLTAELAVRGVPADWFVTLAATAALALSYSAIAKASQLKLGRGPALATRRDLLWLTLIIVAGALFSGTVYVSSFAVGGSAPGSNFIEAIIRYWVGDAVGMLVLLPMLLVLMDRERRSALLLTARSWDWWLVAGLIGGLLWVVFGRDDRDHFKLFYLLFVPVVWSSARLGLSGAVLAAGVTQVGLITAVQSAQNPDLTVFELQVLMAAVTMTGLMLGVAVDERERAAAELRRSLRIAAAGQMAAALAHELSQPLTAMNSYADASRHIVASHDLPDGERFLRLADVSSRMADAALRASEVVKRLRDFFRTGSTQLRPTDVPSLLGDVVAASRPRAEALDIGVRCDIEPDLPHVLADPVQIAVVVRNLVANALDAASAGAGPRRIRVRVEGRRGALLIQVFDTGPGVTSARLQSLFEPGSSDKPGGMGVGLSICRAIVEAHGGALWAESGPSGHFCFTLPVGESNRPGDHRRAS